MASEVTSDLKFELRGLKNLGCRTHLALEGLCEINQTDGRTDGRTDGGLSSIDERGFQPARNKAEHLTNPGITTRPCC